MERGERRNETRERRAEGKGGRGEGITEGTLDEHRGGGESRDGLLLGLTTRERERRVGNRCRRGSITARMHDEHRGEGGERETNYSV